MKIAILYICTGKYNQFFEDFYNSSEKYFLPNTHKHYYVFTDDMSLTKADNVTLIEKECEGFPKDSIMRFKMFLSIKEELLKNDYVYFFNSNMLFVEEISKEILPEKEGEIVFVLNAGYYNQTPFRYPYERNNMSKAFIPFHFRKKYHYVIGGLNGGKVKDYLEFSEICHQRIMDDYKNGILAIYHDESHINRYFYDFGGKLLPSSYAYPEGYQLPFRPKILIRDKTKVDMYFDKVVDHSKKKRVLKALKILQKGITWIFIKNINDN